MTLEEHFETLMKSWEQLQAQNEEMAAQNNYLRKQLGESLKQKRRELRSSFSSRPPGEKKKERNPTPMVPQVKMPLQGPIGDEEDIQPTLITLKLTFRSLKGS